MKELLITCIVTNAILALTNLLNWVYALVYKDVECYLDILKVLIYATLAVVFALQLNQL